MKYSVSYSVRAQDDIRVYKRSGEKKLLVKIEKLIADIQQHPYEGLGKPEPLRYGMSGCWSRKIDKKNRIVYKVEEDRILVLILQLRQHYDDK